MTDGAARAVRAPLILGFLVAGGLLIGLGICAEQARRSPAPELPSLELIAPSSGDTTAAAVVVRFRTNGDLMLTREGWTAGDLHPHIMLDGRELMAAASDIQQAAGEHRWRLPPLAPGTHTLLLAWAARHHGTIGDTAGRTIRFVVEP